MPAVESSAYCAICGRQTLHRKERINNVLHLLLSIVTAGIWALFVWLPLGVLNSSRRQRCTVCGSKPGLAAVKHEVLGPRPTVAQPPASDDVAPSTWLPPGARPPRA